jgi:hypothetical protein
MNPYDKLLHTIFRITVFTLALVIITAVAVMCKALFDPIVDNKEIFAMLSPAFNTVIGAFVGLLGGISLTRPSKEDMFPTIETPSDPTVAGPEVEEEYLVSEPALLVEEAVLEETVALEEASTPAPKKARKAKI